MNDPFIQQIVDRIRDVVARQSGHALDVLAVMLGLEPRAFHVLIEQREQALNTAFIIDVIAAFVREFAIDPQWLLTGQYCATSHQRALMLGDDRSTSSEIALRELIRELPALPFDRRDEPSLVFESKVAVRRIRVFPADWRTLSDDALYALSPPA